MNLANSKKPAFGTQKYQPKRSEKWRNMDIEIANESLLKKMVQIVNVSLLLFIIYIFMFIFMF